MPLIPTAVRSAFNRYPMICGCGDMCKFTRFTTIRGYGGIKLYGGQGICKCGMHNVVMPMPKEKIIGTPWWTK